MHAQLNTNSSACTIGYDFRAWWGGELGSKPSLSGAKSAINKKYFFIWKVFCVRLQRSWTSSLGVNYKIYAALERCNYCKCKTIDDCIIQPHPVRFCLTDTNDRIFFVLMQ